LGQADLHTAQKYFDEALATAWKSQDISIVLDTLISQFTLPHPDPALAVETLTTVINHPAAWQVMKVQAEKLLSELHSKLSVEDFEHAQAQGKNTTLAQIMERGVT
jgi:hypothetical protein